MDRTPRDTWLRAASLFAQIDAWMESDSEDLEALERIIWELRDIGVPRSWIASSLLARRDAPEPD